MPHPPDSSGSRGLAILGSTGSIGRQTLEVVRRFPNLFRVEVLTCGSNAQLVIEQAREFRPSRIVIGDQDLVESVKRELTGMDIDVQGGADAIPDALHLDGIDVVVAAMVGFAGLAPVIRAAELGMTIALANKEALVVAGALVKTISDRTGATIIPVDSEHSAIFQCLRGESIDDVAYLILTASGGPFRDRAVDTFDAITRQEALAHPNWTMGRKITIDSATMMNKGLELIEAHWLFGVETSKIRIVVHPQSVVHSMIEFVDGSIKAQLSQPDMQLPIQYALAYPLRLPSELGRLDWTQPLRLDFEPPDLVKFPCLDLAYEALRIGGAAPTILNAANEVAVSLFLEERISFVDIPLLIEDAMASVDMTSSDSLEALISVDAAARRHVTELKRAIAN